MNQTQVEEQRETLMDVPKDIQESVDEYLTLYEERNRLNKELENLKKQIKPYMQENNIEDIEGTQGQRVSIQDASASNSTSKYSDYNLQDMVDILGTGKNSYIKDVTEIRVNSDKVSGLIKLDKLSKETVDKIKQAKISKEGTPRFVVKK